MDLAVHNDGWISMPLPESGGAVLHARVRDRDGRLVISEVYVHAQEITPAVMRAVSISRLEAGVNALRRDPDSGADVWELAATLTSRLTSFGGQVAEPTLAELRARIPAAHTTVRPPRPRLSRPDGAAPEEFYPRVAAAYSEYAPQTRAPAKEIATEAGVPITTAHRWIREARRRGFLPPAQKGKAG